MSIVEELTARHGERLSGFPAPLTQHFEDGLRALSRRLTDAQVTAWAETGMELTGLSLRSWEAAAEYFKVGARAARKRHLGRDREPRPRGGHHGRRVGAARSLLPALGPGDDGGDRSGPSPAVGRPRAAAVQGQLEELVAGRAVLRPRRHACSRSCGSGRRRAWCCSSTSSRGTATNSPPPAWLRRREVLRQA